MCNYSDLPTLVLNEIFGYLSVKERVRCKSVCRSWKAEVELREKKSDTLILHLGPYLWNIRWSHTNNRSLMKFENSFEIKTLTFLDHPLTRALLTKTKKLAIVNFDRNVFDSVMNSSLDPYVSNFSQCEEIEIRNFELEETVTFDLPKLKSLVFKESPIEKLVLNCPSLELLFSGLKVNEIHFKSTTNLKRLFCFNWPATVSLDGQFQSLQYLNFFTVNDELVRNRLLHLTPKLKRFVFYSRNLQADLASIRRQQESYGLKELELLPFGFSGEPVEIALNTEEAFGYVKIDRCVDQLFDNYSRLVENSPWKFSIDYSQLFSKFKILPGNFFERFSEPFSVEISEVTNYTHLFAFLKCYPFIHQLKIHFAKVKANLILDQMHLLQSSLRQLTIFGWQPSELVDIDVTFIRLFNLVILKLECPLLPVKLLRKVAARAGPFFRAFVFEQITTGHRMLINFDPEGFILVDATCGLNTPVFSSAEKLISAMQSDQHLKTVLLI